MKQFSSVRKLVLSALFLALCLLLPFLTGQLPQLGSMLLPMHLPVLICGFICGPLWALAVGFIAPLLRFVLFQMPPIYPTGVAMAFELLAYGLFAGLFYKLLPKKPLYVYVSLILAMLAGRVVWGAVSAVLYGVAGKAFTWAAFLSGAFATALPGIILQIILVPLIVFAVRKSWKP